MTKALIRKPGMRSVRRGVGDTFLPECCQLVSVAAQERLYVSARGRCGRGRGEAGQLLLQQMAAAVCAGVSDKRLSGHVGTVEGWEARATTEGRSVGTQQTVSVGNFGRLFPQS